MMPNPARFNFSCKYDYENAIFVPKQAKGRKRNYLLLKDYY